MICESDIKSNEIEIPGDGIEVILGMTWTKMSLSAWGTTFSIAHCKARRLPLAAPEPPLTATATDLGVDILYKDKMGVCCICLWMSEWMNESWVNRVSYCVWTHPSTATYYFYLCEIFTVFCYVHTDCISSTKLVKTQNLFSF
jgi:hypothetical protein